MTITRNLAVGAVLVGAAVGLAGPASAAEPLSGSYRYTVTDSNKFPAGSGMPQLFVPCGPDCTREESHPDQSTKEYHLRGSTWSAQIADCQETIDANTLAGRYACPNGKYVNFQLTRD